MGVKLLLLHLLLSHLRCCSCRCVAAAAAATAAATAAAAVCFYCLLCGYRETEKGGDWERRNKLKVLEAIDFMLSRNFNEGMLRCIYTRGASCLYT